MFSSLDQAAFDLDSAGVDLPRHKACLGQGKGAQHLPIKIKFLFYSSFQVTYFLSELLFILTFSTSLITKFSS